MQVENSLFLTLAFLVLSLTIFFKKRFFLFTLFFLLLSLSNPAIERGFKIIKDKNIEVVLALDLSRSMEFDDIKPNRKIAALKKAIDFIKLSDNLNIAVIVFGQKSFLISPLTKDKNQLIERLENFNLNSFKEVKGTNFKNAISSSLLLFSSLNRHIVFFSDGGDESDTSGIGFFAKKANIRLYSILIATNEEFFIDENKIILNQTFEDEIKRSGGLLSKYDIKNKDIKNILNMIEKSANSTLKVPKILNLFFIPALIVFGIIFYKRYFLILLLFLNTTTLKANFLGSLFAKMGQDSIAKYFLTPPKNDIEKYNLAIIYAKEGKNEKAINLFNQIKNKSLSNLSKFNIAMIKAKEGSLQEALNLLIDLKKTYDTPKVRQKIRIIKRLLKKKKLHSKKLKKSQKQKKLMKNVVKETIRIDFNDISENGINIGSRGGKPW